MNDFISKITDPYERKARLFPALLAMFPLIIMTATMYGSKMSSLSNVGFILASCGGLYLMTNLCRECGKRLEPRLFEEWGGKPTTQLLRHRHNVIEEVTKRRYHTFLAERIHAIFPNHEEEMQNPVAADEVYQSSIRWLLNHTRDKKKFALLFEENIAYGFRRNALAVKPIALFICVGSILWVLMAEGALTRTGDYFFNKTALMALPETTIASLLASGLMLLVWVAFFTKTSVRTAAFTYAETLLRACDEL